MVRVERLHHFSELAALADDWNRLAGDCPFRRLEWLGAWWKHYGGPSKLNGHKKLYVVVVRDSEERVVAIAPWFIERQPARGRVVQFLGSGKVCTDYLSILAQPEHQQTALAALAQWLHEAGVHGARPGDRWDWMEWQEVVDGDPALEELGALLAAQEYRVERQRRMHTWRINLPATWPEYLAKLSKSHREQARRIERDVAASEELRLRVVADRGELAPALAALIDLHQRRWQSLGEPGCFADGRFTAFLSEAAEHFAALGALEILLLEHEGIPVAAEWNLLGRDGVTYMYQSGLDPDLLRDKIGRAMHVLSIRRAVEQGRRGFDMLRGDEPYKIHWRAEPTPLATWQIVPPRIAPRLRHGMITLGGHMRAWIKEALAAAGMRGEAK